MHSTSDLNDPIFTPIDLSKTLAIAEIPRRAGPLPLTAAIQRAQDWLLAEQQSDGHWVAELEGDTILETDYALLLYFLGDPPADKMRKLCNYILQRWQNAEGGFPIYPDGPSDVSASVKAYFACRLAGHPADAPYMRRLQECILRLGGVTQCNTFTKLYLAIFGQYDWEGVPTVPPEVMLLPSWLYLNLYEMSSWSRAILVPLGIISSTRPHRPVPPDCHLDALFVGGRTGPHLRLPRDPHSFSWRNTFLGIDSLLKMYHRSPVKPLRRRALKAAETWLRTRQDSSDGLSAIFPAMVHTVMAFTCLGYPADHPAVRHELHELERFEIEEGDTLRLQPCLSPVWDTAIAVNSLLESGLSADHPAIERAVTWLLDRQIITTGDWAVKTKGVAPGGWCFEYANAFYPDTDDTAVVLMALYKAACPQGRPWTSAPPRVREAMRRGLEWLLAMQCRNGGWASFDKDNDKMLFQYVPYADHNAMLDPATADITGHVLECLGLYGFRPEDSRIQRAIAFLEREQETDGSWFGRWGVNYLYGTWEVLCGLNSVRADRETALFRRAAAWLAAVQNGDGGWGENCRSYEDPARFKAKGVSTPSQTSWALLGLFAADQGGSKAAQEGVTYLLQTQREDGTWDEEQFTGTGFPRVFYLRYHLYRHCFPLWTLGQAASHSGSQK
jgi:squalene-hopene/tetraprenyl-beta-curcumene cyclase